MTTELVVSLYDESARTRGVLDDFTGIMFGLTERTHTNRTCGLVRINVVVGCANMVARRLAVADVTITCASHGEWLFQSKRHTDYLHG